MAGKNDDLRSPKAIPRREFIQISAVATAAGLGLAGCSTPTASWRSLTTQEASLVESISDVLIPGDQDPGAREAGVVHFIDRQLAGAYRQDLGRYRAGLSSFESTCSQVYGRSFLELSPNEQVELLKAVESEEVPDGIWTEESSGSFFSLILDHSMQGFYGNPRHGGNRDYVSYRMLELDYPQILPRPKSV